VLFYAYMPMLLCDRQVLLKKVITTTTTAAIAMQVGVNGTEGLTTVSLYTSWAKNRTGPY